MLTKKSLKKLRAYLKKRMIEYTEEKDGRSIVKILIVNVFVSSVALIEINEIPDVQCYYSSGGALVCH